MASGRQITCNHCGHKTVKGAARVSRKILFFFCPRCWFDRREGCNSLMLCVSRSGSLQESRAA
jgi:hypothetical protein